MRRSNKKNVVHSPRLAKYPEAEERLYVWLTERTSIGLPVKFEELKKEMLALVPSTAEFKSSNGWVCGFKKRHVLSSRRATTAHLVRQSTPQNDKVKRDFQRELAKQRGVIYNMDEVPVWLDMPYSYTVAIKRN